MSYSMLIYFLGASVALTIAPGPDNIFVITQGIARGRRAAIVTALGMCSGISVHTTAAALGISAVFYSSVVAFNVVKYAGAAYLLYLAYRTLKEKSLVKLDGAVDLPAASLFRRGFVMNVLNPKVALFFLAFLPQFVTQGGKYIPVQMLALGFIFMVQAIVIFCFIGYFAGSIGGFIAGRPRMSKYFDWLTAGVFASLGVRLALAQR
jgi:threonine/homoserine/homoserine lactone efflux protein